MLFNSLQFLMFFPIVCMVYFAIPLKARWVWLLMASYYFYMCWNPKYALLMFASTLITWLSGFFISRFNRLEDGGKKDVSKKLTVAISFISNLLILFFFKYFDFAVDNVNRVLSLFNFELITPDFDVILPVGISFYTFQALSYTMDVYRGDVPAEKNLFRYALFVSFFPQLVAGPIERSKNLLHQLKDNHSFDAIEVKKGLFLMLWGFFQKLVIADRVAICVNAVYNNQSEYGAIALIAATVLFALQIYCDFSSYTNIARGAAQVMGFRLMDNFREPYFSRSIAEFWRRWHISLSGWFRDYLYIPLGGNKKGKLRKYFNLMVVFLVSGLWHGASWHYVVWGVIHGVYQIIGDITLKLRKNLCDTIHIDRESGFYHSIQCVITFILVCFGLIFFRANNMSDAICIIKGIFTKWDVPVIEYGNIMNMGLDIYQYFVILVSTAVLFFVSCLHYRGKCIRDKILEKNIFIRWSVAFVMIFVVLIFGIYGPGYDESQFIYFQF